MRKAAAITGTIIALLPTLPSQASTPKVECSIDNAVYRSPGDNGLIIKLHKVKKRAGLVSDLVIEIKGAKLGEEWWYFFDQGSSDQITLVSTTDPLVSAWNPAFDGAMRPHGSASFIGLNGNGNMLLQAPVSGAKPVKYLVIPELGDAFKKYASSMSYRPSAFIFSGCES